MQPEFIAPEWPAPAHVRACATTRHGGVSAGCYASLNLALHTGDVKAHVEENRRRVTAAAAAPPICWLDQVHGTTVVDAHGSYAAPPRADASVCRAPGSACAIMTADCLPVLLCDRAGTFVAAAHCGWRGFVAGVLPALLAQLPGPRSEILAWLGPAIGVARYEVGDDVRAALLRRVVASTVAGAMHRGDRDGKWSLDLSVLARAELSGCGVEQIYGGGYCTYDDARFFSYRRDGVTGRMAALIWLSKRR